MKQVQICIVSAEPMANILPIRALKPDIVVLVVSARMKQAGVRLSRFLARHGIRSVEAFDAPDHGLAAIRKFALDRIQEMTTAGVPPENLTLNATGGNKLMAMGFIEAAKDAGLGQIIYADTSHDCIEFIHPEALEPLPMGKLATLNDLFESRGLQIIEIASNSSVWQSRVRGRAKLTRWLLHQALRKPSPLRRLRSNFNPKSATQPISKQLKQRLLAEGLILPQNDQNPLLVKPSDSDALAYLQGGWLEEFVWLESSKIQHAVVGCGLKLKLEEDSQSNQGLHELDLVIIHRNRLVLGECKVSRTTATEADKDLDRLRALAASIAGPFGKLVYIVSETNRSEATIRKRCNNRPQIQMVSRQELLNLRDLLQQQLAA